MTLRDKEPLFTTEDLMYLLLPLTCALTAMMVVRFVAGPQPGPELMVGLLIEHAFFIELVYFREINRFEAERNEPELWF